MRAKLLFKEFIMKKILIFILIICSSSSHAICELNVDSVKTLYINGMFTDAYDAESNRQAIESLITQKLPWFESSTLLLHNQSEFPIIQIFEVIRQKYEDRKSSRAIIEFLNNDANFLNDIVNEDIVQSFLRDIKKYYNYSEKDEDGKRLIQKTTELLNTCSRIILITHSQGNFYGNMVLNHIYSEYSFLSGYSIFKYPMLGNMQIASPVDIPGGAITLVHPEIIGHITNDNDVIMSLVRHTIGSIASNYDSPEIKADWSGHGLEHSYLNMPGQSSVIVNELARIAYALTPYPMHRQEPITTSTAIMGFGYSLLNNILDIQFTDKTLYRYFDVPDSVALGLIEAEAKGTYFNKSIRNNFTYQKY